MKLKFLIQKQNSEYFDYDFCDGLYKAIQYQKWLMNYDINNLQYIDYQLIDMRLLLNTQINKDYIPCGSIEFVTTYMQQIGLPIPKPVNVPMPLQDKNNSGRVLYETEWESFETLYKMEDKKNWFVKSFKKIKGLSGLLSDCKSKIIKSENYQFSEIIDIKSEWRCFIYKNQLVGLQNYQGDFTLFPNIEKIKSMIKAYNGQPIAYTLDVYINEYNETYCLEVHDFFSCGLYGFADYKILSFMFSDWWNEYKNKVR
jgi:hypothetical protein